MVVFLLSPLARYATHRSSLTGCAPAVLVGAIVVVRRRFPVAEVYSPGCIFLLLWLSSSFVVRRRLLPTFAPGSALGG